MKVAIVASKFNQDISNNLIKGALAKLKKNNFSSKNVTIYEVPGAFEIPFFISKLLDASNRFDAIIAFGSVIKGETAHFEYIAKTVTDNIMKLSIENKSKTPILYGILTCYNHEQALERSLIKYKDKGGEVMQATIDLIKSFRELN